jgi:hypothetical protein
MFFVKYLGLNVGGPTPITLERILESGRRLAGIHGGNGTSASGVA